MFNPNGLNIWELSGLTKSTPKKIMKLVVPQVPAILRKK